MFTKILRARGCHSFRCRSASHPSCPFVLLLRPSTLATSPDPSFPPSRHREAFEKAKERADAPTPEEVMAHLKGAFGNVSSEVLSSITALIFRQIIIILMFVYSDLVVQDIEMKKAQIEALSPAEKLRLMESMSKFLDPKKKIKVDGPRPVSPIDFDTYRAQAEVRELPSPSPSAHASRLTQKASSSPRTLTPCNPKMSCAP